MGPLLLRNLRHMRALLVVLAIAMVGLHVLIINLAAQFDAGPGLNEFFAMLPEMIRRMVGAQVGELTFPGMVAFAFQHPMLLVAALALMILCGTIPAGDRDIGTLDLFLARPVPRRRYVGAVLGCMVLGAMVLVLGMVIGNALGLATVQVATERPWTDYLPIALDLFGLLLAIGGIALLLATGPGRRGTAVARAVGVTLVLYLLESLGQLSDATAALSWLSPFHYFSPVRALMLGGTPWYNAPVLLAVAAVTVLLAFRRFERADA
jgi:ABC-2 type transport system permease protein